MFTKSSINLTKYLVGIGHRDFNHSIATLKKVCTKLAKPTDTVIALHIPRPLPYEILSSISEADAISSEEHNFVNFDFLSRNSAEHSQGILDRAREAINGLTEANVVFKAVSPSNDVKTDIVEIAKSEGADVLCLGNGLRGEGHIVHFAANNLPDSCSLFVSK